MTTQMAGPPEKPWPRKPAYFAALPKAATYQVTDDSLTLLDDKGKVLGEVRSRGADLADRDRVAGSGLQQRQGRRSSRSRPTASITAVFGTDGSLAGNASINQYSTKYTTSADGR